MKKICKRNFNIQKNLITINSKTKKELPINDKRLYYFEGSTINKKIVSLLAL